MKNIIFSILGLSIANTTLAEKKISLHKICLENKKSLLVLKVKDGIATIVSKNASDYDYGSDKHVSKVDLNKDKFMDYTMYLGGCGTGGCMESVLLNCGDNKTYYPFIDAEYFSHAGNVEVDEKNRSKFGNEAWAHIKFLEYFQKIPYPIVMGYRYQFDGKKYVLHFTPSEYMFLIKKAKKGKDFAVAQLIEVAYPRIKDMMKGADYQEVKKALLDPEFIKIIKKNPEYRPIETFTSELSILEPSIQCTIVKVHSKIEILGFKNFPQLHQSINNDPLTSKLSIAGKEFEKLNPKSVMKIQDKEEIMIKHNGGQLKIVLAGKPMARSGTLKESGQLIADITCH